MPRAFEFDATQRENPALAKFANHVDLMMQIPPSSQGLRA
jgi:hypothetical protein